MFSYICVKQDFTAGWLPGILWMAIFYKKAFHFSHVAFKCKLLIWAGPIAYFGWPLFKFWLKACLYKNQQILHVHAWYQSPNFTLELHVHVYFVDYHSNFWLLKSNCWQRGYIWNKQPPIKQILHPTVVVVWQKQCIPDWKAPYVPECRGTKLKICGSEYSIFNIFYK